jgi:UDP-N-acetylglucosamine acyltransferase
MIHPTAVISAEARLGANVSIGPFCVIEGAVSIGDDCELRSGARVIGPLTMGVRNVVWGGAVIGGWPQDRKFKGEHSELVIGDENVFREAVSIHRGTGLNTKTVIGSRNYFMVNSHVGHNCVLGNDITLVNGAALGGFVQVADRAMIGAGSAVHQFCRVGRLAMISNLAALNVDLPPFFISMATNTLTQLNNVGLRRSGMSKESINAVRTMFRLVFRENRDRPLKVAFAELPGEVREVAEVREVMEFCGGTKRGVALFRPWSGSKRAGRSMEGEGE